MNFQELIKRRYACRKYTDKLVEESKIEQILEAGRFAPTAADTQSVSVMVIKEANKIKEIVNVYEAPVVFVICADRNLVWKREFDKKEFCDVDSSIAATHMMLMATELRLDSIWISYFDPKKLCELLKIPDNFEVTSILGVGYGEEVDNEIRTHLVSRKSINQFRIDANL